MADSKVFDISSGIQVIDIAYALESFFTEKKGLEAELLETPEGIIVQAKQKEGWKKLVGMDNSVQVQLFEQKDTVIVNVGAGKWIDKAGAATVGVLVFAPLAITAAIGAWANKKLPEEIFDTVEKFILGGGKTVVKSMRMSNALDEGEILCPRCKGKNTKGTKFCHACGEKLFVECPQCKNSVPPGTRFCTECGSNIPVAAAPACPQCKTTVEAGTKFCPECGSTITS